MSTKIRGMKMFKIDYSYLEDCDGNYSKSIDKIETVERYMNTAANGLPVALVLDTVLAILGLKEENDERI